MLEIFNTHILVRHTKLFLVYLRRIISIENFSAKFSLPLPARRNLKQNVRGIYCVLFTFYITNVSSKVVYFSNAYLNYIVINL
jgi:hypothetical protein